MDAINMMALMNKRDYGKKKWEVMKMQTKAEIPVTLVEHMTDPRAAQLQMLFASLDERGKKTLVAMAATMVKLHKDSEHG